MKGLELSKKYYFEFGKPMLESSFSELLPHIAVGLVGSGSECLGFDDDLSHDHDFEPGFCIFLPDESVVDRKAEFALERAYSKLPNEFMGYKRSLLKPVGGKRNGVIRTEDFIEKLTGKKNGVLTTEDYFVIPEQALLEVISGELFFDGFGVISRIRDELSYLPENVRLKKLAGHLLIMAQSGQYNYERCIQRGETAAAQLAVGEFVKSALHAIFLLNKRYIPYYKWSFKALSTLPLLSHLYGELEYLISSGNTENEYAKKQGIIEKISVEVINELKLQSLTKEAGGELELHAYSVNDMITDANIRSLHILYAI